MTTITWNPKTMATGVPEVDAQHQEWIRRYNQFDDAINQAKGIEAVQSTLDFFIRYADVHFKFEETVMDECHCPAAKDNHAAIKEVTGLKHQMEGWLVKHILTIDIQLRDS